MDNLIYTPFGEIDLEDVFFDSLRANYDGFDSWFSRKAANGECAYVYEDESGKLLDFLYLKDECEQLQMDGETLPVARRLKVGTFKIEHRGTKRGERFMKKILDTAIGGDFNEVYVTMFDDTEELSFLKDFFKRYGFEEIGRKSSSKEKCEAVLLRDMRKSHNDIVQDYPFVDISSGSDYILSIIPDFHTRLFSDSILHNENGYEILKDESPTNGINKTYVCKMRDAQKFKRGDHLVIYRTTDGQGSAYYRSVATSLCTVLDVKSKQDFGDLKAFQEYCGNRSVYDESALARWYGNWNFFAVKMLYNMAFRKKVIRKDIIEQVGVPEGDYWGVHSLTKDQVRSLLKLGQADERYIID